MGIAYQSNGAGSSSNNGNIGIASKTIKIAPTPTDYRVQQETDFLPEGAKDLFSKGYRILQKVFNPDKALISDALKDIDRQESNTFQPNSLEQNFLYDPRLLIFKAGSEMSVKPNPTINSSENQTSDKKNHHYQGEYGSDKYNRAYEKEKTDSKSNSNTLYNTNEGIKLLQQEMIKYIKKQYDLQSEPLEDISDLQGTEKSNSYQSIEMLIYDSQPGSYNNETEYGSQDVPVVKLYSDSGEDYTSPAKKNSEHYQSKDSIEHKVIPFKIKENAESIDSIVMRLAA